MGTRIVGTLTNLSDMPLKNVWVAHVTGAGDFTLTRSESSATAPSTGPTVLSAIPPHTTVRVEAKISVPPPKKYIEPSYSYHYYGQGNGETPLESELPTIAFNLNARRGTPCRS